MVNGDNGDNGGNGDGDGDGPGDGGRPSAVGGRGWSRGSWSWSVVRPSSLVVVLTRSTLEGGRRICLRNSASNGIVGIEFHDILNFWKIHQKEIFG